MHVGSTGGKKGHIEKAAAEKVLHEVETNAALAIKNADFLSSDPRKHLRVCGTCQVPAVLVPLRL